MTQSAKVKWHEHKSIGKKRGSVVLDDWYKSGQQMSFGSPSARPWTSVVPVDSTFAHFGPKKDRGEHVRGYAVRMPSGQWRLTTSPAAGKREYKQALRLADTTFQWAESMETAVRKALKKTKPKRIKAKYIDEDVLSSYLYPAQRTQSHTDPFIVYVYTEGGIGDPYYYKDVFSWFARAERELAKDSWYEDAGWESLRAGVAYFWVKPKMIG